MLTIEAHSDRKSEIRSSHNNLYAITSCETSLASTSMQGLNAKTSSASTSMQELRAEISQESIRTNDNSNIKFGTKTIEL